MLSIASLNSGFGLFLQNLLERFSEIARLRSYILRLFLNDLLFVGNMVIDPQSKILESLAAG